jgi:hypothetical protein
MGMLDEERSGSKKERAAQTKAADVGNLGKKLGKPIRLLVSINP